MCDYDILSGLLPRLTQQGNGGFHTCADHLYIYHTLIKFPRILRVLKRSLTLTGFSPPRRIFPSVRFTAAVSSAYVRSVSMARPIKRATKQNMRSKRQRRPLARQLVIAASPPPSSGGLAVQKKATNGSKAGKVHAIGETGAQYGINAFSPIHLPLPRPVAPYSVVRTIQNFTITGNGTPQMMCFLPFQEMIPGTSGLGSAVRTRPFLKSYCGYAVSNTGTSPSIDGLDFLNFSALGNQAGIASGIECVPAAMTIRITCPSALQNATGQFFLGRWAVAGDPRQYSTYEDMRSGFLSFGQPRPLTAARLAMRGVEVSSVIRDMNVASDFLPLHASDPGDKRVTVAAYQNESTVSPWPGFTPIFLLAEDSVTSETSLNVQVAVEWRWRFALDNVAASTHTYHKPAAPSTWGHIMEAAANVGHGVKVIADAAPAVAEAATAATRFIKTAGPMLFP